VQTTQEWKGPHLVETWLRQEMRLYCCESPSRWIQKRSVNGDPELKDAYARTTGNTCEVAGHVTHSTVSHDTNCRAEPSYLDDQCKCVASSIRQGEANFTLASWGECLGQFVLLKVSAAQRELFWRKCACIDHCIDTILKCRYVFTHLIEDLLTLAMSCISMSCGKAWHADSFFINSGEERPSFQHEAKASFHTWRRGKHMTLTRLRRGCRLGFSLETQFITMQRWYCMLDSPCWKVILPATMILDVR